MSDNALGLLLPAIAALNFLCGYRSARAIWKRRADQWFTRAMEENRARFVERVLAARPGRTDLHPWFHVTRWATVDEIVAGLSDAPPSERTEP